VDRLRVGLAGLGRMGRIHLASLARHCPSAELVAVTDADPAVAAAVGAEVGVSAVPDFDALLSDVDAVVVATPTGTHAELVSRAARAGRAVFCEKPVSLERPATVDTLAAVAEAGVPFQVGFHRRFDPDWIAATERIRAGELGQVYLFRSSLRDMRAPDPAFLASSGGFFLDVTIHDLDTARWMVGEVAEVYATGAALSDPRFADVGDIDTALVTLRFASGALGVIDNSRSAGYGYECSTEVVGSAATVRIDNRPPRHYRWLTPGADSTGIPRDFQERYPEAYPAELEGFARAVLTGRPVAVGGADALAAYDLAVAADRSWRTGLAVRVNPPD
jgi:myo-inositol 2-dehydrogenase / D-chiro-inositol 1-dehydrogenase